MKNIVIIGNSSFSRLLYQYMIEDGYSNIVAFSVNKAFLTGETGFSTINIVALEDLSVLYPPDKTILVMGIGYTAMNTVREKVYCECKKMGYEFMSYIHSTAKISSSAEIGEGNIILEYTNIAPFVKLGNCNLLWDYVSIAHEDNVGNFNTFSGAAGLSGCVLVGNNCFFGKHSYTVDHISVADFTLIGAGAGVKSNTSPYDVIVPAKSVTLPGRKSTEFI